MLKEFVDSIAGYAVKAEKVTTTELPGNRLLIRYPSGETKEIDRDPETHEDQLASFTSLQEWAGEYNHLDLEFFVSHESVSVFAKREQPTKSCSAHVNFKKSAAFADLLAWSSTARSIKQVVRGLRTCLEGTCTDEYRAIFKRVDFKRKNDGSKSVSHVGESMGRSVEAEAQSAAGEIPEELRFTVQLFSNVPVESYDLTFAVEVDADAEKVQIFPVGDCIETAIQATRLDLVTRLKAEFNSALVVESV